MNIYYDSFHQSLASGNIKLLTDEIRAVLLSSSYVFDRTHNRVEDLVSGFVSGAKIVTTANNPILAGKTFIVSSITGQATVFDADDVVFSTLSANSEAQYVALYDQTADDAGVNSLICIMEFDDIKVANDTGNFFLSWSEFGIFDVGVGDKTGGFEHSHTNKVYLSYIDQPLNKNASVNFASLKLLSGLTAGTIGGINSADLKLSSNLDMNGYKIAGIAVLADNTKVMHLAGDETITDTKTFSGKLKAPVAPSDNNDVTNKAYVDGLTNTWAGTKNDEFIINWKSTLDATAIRLKAITNALSILNSAGEVCALNATGFVSDYFLLGAQRDGTYNSGVGISAANGVAAGKQSHTLKYDLDTDAWYIGDGIDWVQLVDGSHAHSKSAIYDFEEADYVHTRPDAPAIEEVVGGIKLHMSPRFVEEFPIWQVGAVYTKTTTPKVWAYNSETGGCDVYTLIDDHTSVGPTITNDIAHWTKATIAQTRHKPAFATGTLEKTFAVDLDGDNESALTAVGNGLLSGKIMAKNVISTFGDLLRTPPENTVITITKNQLVYDDATNTIYRALVNFTTATTDARVKMNPSSPSYNASYIFYLYDTTKFEPLHGAAPYSATTRYYLNDVVEIPSTAYNVKSAMYRLTNAPDDGVVGKAIDAVDGNNANYWTLISVIENIWQPGATLDTSSQKTYVVSTAADQQIYAYEYTQSVDLVVSGSTAATNAYTWDHEQDGFMVNSKATSVVRWKPGVAYAAGAFVTYKKISAGAAVADTLALYKTAAAYTSTNTGSADADFITDLTSGAVVLIPSIDDLFANANADPLFAAVTIKEGDVYAHLHVGEKYAGSYIYAAGTSVATGLYFDDEEAAKWTQALNPHMQNVYLDELVHIILSTGSTSLTFIIDETVFDGYILNIKTVKQTSLIYPRGAQSYIDDVYNYASPMALNVFDNITLLCSDAQLYLM